MSYILDALRKAEAQRERGAPRGIHAQPVPATLERGGGSWRKPVLVAVPVLLLAAVAAVWLRPVATTPMAGGMPPSAPAAPAPVPMPLPGPAPQPAAAPPPSAMLLPAPPPPAVVAAPRPQLPQPAAAAPAPPVRTASAAAPAVPAAAPAAVAAKPASAPASAPALASADRVPAFAELPPEVQRDVPKLSISGGVYSDNPAQRMLIVGGQVFGEGAELAPGLVLEQIRPKSAVLRIRGQRFTVAY